MPAPPPTSLKFVMKHGADDERMVAGAHHPVQQRRHQLGHASGRWCDMVDHSGAADGDAAACTRLSTGTWANSDSGRTSGCGRAVRPSARRARRQQVSLASRCPRFVAISGAIRLDSPWPLNATSPLRASWISRSDPMTGLPSSSVATCSSLRGLMTRQRGCTIGSRRCEVCPRPATCEPSASAVVRRGSSAEEALHRRLRRCSRSVAVAVAHPVMCCVR